MKSLLARRFLRWIYDCIVDFVATFVADLLSHQAVQEGSATIVAGMNASLTQPQLDELMLEVNNSVSKTQGKEEDEG